MKRSSILIAVFILFLFLVAVQGGQAAPQLDVVGGTTFDFGNVQANQTLRNIFIFKNHGDSVLNIEQAKGG